MADDVEELGALLRCYRLRAGLTQEELAERAGLSARGISDLERGLRLAPHRDTVRMLADALALPPDDQARLARNIDRHRRPAAAITTSFMPTLAALPIRRTSFIGREHERVRLRDLLTRPSVRLVTLTGLGGVGKTRLALEVASDLQESGTPSIGFISLATIHDPGQLATTILQALRGREDPRQTAEETLKQMLSGEARLLLLDNFEQIVEAAPLLSDLLAACSELKLMVTSRVPLRLAGEHIFPLAPLASAAAVELFAARAHAIQHDAPSVSWDVSMLEAICSRLDNLPLALELAAPHVAVLPPPCVTANETALPAIA